MNQLHGPLHDRIEALLRAERRTVIIEDICLGFLFAVCAVALTLFGGLLIFVVLSYLFYFHGRGPIRSPIVSLETIRNISVVLLIGLAWFKRRLLLRGDKAGPPTLSLFPVSYLDPASLAEELTFGLVLLGPRCAIVAWQFLHYSWEISRLDLSRLASIIEDSLSRRKTRQQHLPPAVDIESFLEQTTWLNGIIPQYRPPGFFFTGQFRREIGGPDAPPQHPEEETDTDDQPVDDGLDEEVRWALLLMGLPQNATRAEVQSAYRALAKQVHPDSQPDDSTRRDAEEKMKELNLAYEILRRRPR